MAAVRDLKIDGLKILMIFFVVLGHMGGYDDYGIGSHGIIYSFHMPVFIFLSGYFTSQKTSEEKQVSWIKQTVVIYLIAQIAHVILEILLKYVACQIKQLPFDYSFDLIDIFFFPRYALWYLLCLIYWRIAIWKISDKIDDNILLISSFVLVLVAGFVPIDHTFSFQRTFSFLPFFVLGVMFRKRNWMAQLEKVPMHYAIIGLLVGLALSKTLPTYLPKIHYENWQDPLIRICQTMLGIYLCLLILRISRIREIDENAFVTVSDCYQVIGGRENRIFG